MSLSIGRFRVDVWHVTTEGLKEQAELVGGLSAGAAFIDCEPNTCIKHEI